MVTQSAGKIESPAARSLPEALVRFLRHEVGDLLQTIYATVAILQKRLPAEWNLERRILGDMRSRAEACKELLDTVHDFACPVSLALDQVDVAELTALLVDAAGAHYPQLNVKAEVAGALPLLADERRLAQVGNCLLDNACQAARQQVWFRAGKDPANGDVEWTVTDDGPGVPAEEMEHIFKPFFTTRHGHAGLGLALAQKMVLLHGGRIVAENVPEGGFRVRVVLPAAATPNLA